MKQRYSVVIVGAGPTGLTLANLLGGEGIDTLLVERNPSTVNEPRGVSIDDESSRTMQAIGLVDEVLSAVVPGYGSHYYSAGGSCFAIVEPTQSPYGYPKRNAFRQPILEAQLRKGLERFPTVTTLFGWKLESFTQTEAQATVKIAGPQGETVDIACDYLIGCDGASSSIRQGLDIGLDGATFAERWLIIDQENSRNTVRHTKVFCDPKRACITLPGPNDTRRFEFKLHPHETDAELLEPATVERLLRDHGGDPEATLRRKVVYGFHARKATRWRVGRILIAGDAAHLMPPFAGQGMNSGIRDAHNLGWKLATIVRGEIGPGLLDSYELERKEHVQKMIDLALRMGRVMAPVNMLDALITQTFYRALKLCPPARDYILQMKYKPPPQFRVGFLAAKESPKSLIGRLFPQPKVMTAEGRTARLDEVVGNRFALLAYTAEPGKAFAGFTQDVWGRIKVARVAVVPPGRALQSVPGVTVVQAADEAFQNILAPYPGQALLLRPDHYVAACIPLSEAARGADIVNALLVHT